MSKLAVRVAWVGLGSYFYFYVLPQWAAAVEKNGKNSVQVWNVMLTNQRLMLKKLVEIEKRSEE